MEGLDRFVAMLGHELRNPLAAILTALDVLCARDGKLQRETAITEHQTNHLVRLVAEVSIRWPRAAAS